MELELDDDHLSMSTPSFKTKLKHSLCFSCCFRSHRRSSHSHRRILDSPPPSGAAVSDERPAVIWLKKKVSHELRDDIKDKCMTVFSRIGTNKHRRHSSAEFRYDPLSYALNFEDEFDGDDEAPLRNFSSRLPPSPPVKTMPPVREIAAVS